MRHGIVMITYLLSASGVVASIAFLLSVLFFKIMESLRLRKRILITSIDIGGCRNAVCYAESCPRPRHPRISNKTW
jgi:hypothetical protein